MVNITELSSSDSEGSSTVESLDDAIPLLKKTQTRRSVGSDMEAEQNSASDDSEVASSNSEDESDVSHASDDDEENENDEKEEDLSHLPLGERLKRQLERGNGNKPKNASANPLMNAKKGTRNSDSAVAQPKKSKHAPTEASSKRQDFYLRQQFHKVGAVAVGTSVDVHAHRYKPRDPREMLAENLGSSSGRSSVMPHHHPEDFAFLQEMRTKEIATLQRRLQARQLSGNRGKEQRKRYGIRHDDAEGLQHDQKELHRLLQEKAAYERQNLDRAAQRAVRENLKAASGESTAARKYRPKQRELKRMYMEAKYDLLQEKKGGTAAIDQILEKRRKKQKTKHSKMPSVL